MKNKKVYLLKVWIMEKLVIIEWCIVTVCGLFGPYHLWRLNKILRKVQRTGGNKNELK